MYLCPEVNRVQFSLGNTMVNFREALVSFFSFHSFKLL
jgi:hypothetical protein